LEDASGTEAKGHQDQRWDIAPYLDGNFVLKHNGMIGLPTNNKFLNIREREIFLLAIAPEIPLPLCFNRRVKLGE
jgi:hypothetical protein